MRRRLPVLAAVSALLLLPAAPAVAAGPTLTGVVTLGGAPHAGTPVAWFEPGSTALTSTRTDAEGRFSMPAPAAGTHYLLAVNLADVLTAPRAADVRFLPAYVGTGADDVPAAPLATPLVADGGARAITVDVARSSRVEGRTTAFAGSTVELRTTSDEVTATTTASATGAWSFRVAPGDYRVTQGGSVDRLPYRSRVIHVGTGTVDLHAHPIRTAALRGTVTAGGRAVRGAFVSFEGPDTAVVPVGDGVRTDRAGHWVRTGLAPGRYRVRVSRGETATDSASYVSAVRSVTAYPGDTERVAIGLHRGATLSGSVQLPPGEPFTDWTVQLRDASGGNVAEGSFHGPDRALNAFRFVSLKAGTYRLLVLTGGRMLDRTVRVASRAKVRVGVLRTTTEAVALSGTAPAGAFVYAYGPGSLAGGATAAADGSFRIGDLLPGTYTVRVGIDSRGTETPVTLPTAGPVTLDAGPETGSRFQHITGRVLAGAVPVPSADIRLTSGGRMGVRDGRIESTILSAGTYDVRSVQTATGTLFPRGTPYHLVWTAPRIAVQDRVDLDLGTVSLEVRGGP